MDDLIKRMRTEYAMCSIVDGLEDVAAVLKEAMEALEAARQPQERGEAMHRVLSQIISDLPTRRDWLDPSLEAEAKALISAHPAPTARIAELEAQLAESEKAREGLRVALEAFVAAQVMSSYGEYSKIDWQRPNTTFHKEWGGGDCEKHGRWYGAGCICCDDEWKKLKNKADREAEYSRDKALRAASDLAMAALAADKE